jgi:hypothetical protein
MPPPPPPSKSYLLVFDTDSEDEEEEAYRISQRPMAVTPPSLPTTHTLPARPPSTTAESSTPAQSNAGTRRPHLVEDEEDDEDEEEIIRSSSDDASRSPSDSNSTSNRKLTKNQKKKRSRKRNKKSAKSSTEDDDKKPSISFSTVSVRTYPRCFSGDAVPADGGWPLGMARDHFYEMEEALPLEDYERSRQEALKERWEHIRETNKDMDASVERNMTQRPPGVPLLLETRRWDYRIDIKNPLFGASSEEQRQALFLGSTESKDDDSFSSSISKSTGRSRSNSVGSTFSSNNSSSSPSKRRDRSNSAASSEQFNETYNQVYVHHVRNELEQLRIERTKSGATGCNCRKLTVYLPPKDGSSGKRAQHRRMKPSKVAQELKKREIYDPGASREASEQTLHDAVEAEPCCSGNDCFCIRNGLDCQADACSCWHDSHVHNKSGGVFLSVRKIKSRCGNPLGMATVDNEAIDKFRKVVLESNSIICHPVGAANDQY